MTVFTTVGYGSHSYYENEEYGLALLLMFFSAFYGPFLLFIGQKYGMILYDSYQVLMYEVEEKILYWLYRL